MPLGGGTFLVQNKILPGSYINFVSAARASAALSERGIATMPLELSWGPDDTIFSVTAEEFQKNSLRIFGYPYTHDALKGLRDLFIHIRTGHFYKLNSGGAKATSIYATALYKGKRGNDLKIVIEASENSTPETPLFDVTTLMDKVAVDIQKNIAQASNLAANAFVSFDAEATLALTAGTPLTGGADGAVAAAAYQSYLDLIESYTFNTMGCLTADSAVKGLFINFTRRMRDDVGVKFQTVLFRPIANYEGIIGLENGLVGAKDDHSLVYWLTGAEAGCAVNASLLNRTYNGEHDIDVAYTQAELEAAIQNGKLIFHRVGDEVRVLEDINTFTEFTVDKSADFGNNQTIRVLDQIGNDIATLFNSKYLGKVPNDNAGRISLWNDIVTHHQQLQSIRAIENFTGEDVTVEQGESKKAVVVTDHVTPTNAMAQLYMTVIVE